MSLQTDTSDRPPAWLEVIRGSAPILLIAPHGGSAGPRSQAALHPKVNDLETAAITRELADRLDAIALINCGMDRNDLDCNRLSQLIDRDPRLLTLIAEETSRIVERHPCATVLLIHGWNIIEPRVDLGLGVRQIQARLQPPRGACISADDTFINNTALGLADRLRAAGIVPTFGLRYPGAGSQNLLQAFTARHANSNHPALQQLATLAAHGRINALQLELSVAVRMPGTYRSSAIAAIAASFIDAPVAGSRGHSIEVVRDSTRHSLTTTRRAEAAPAFRIGIEFYDPTQRLGGMASFDFGANAAGGRIMMLFERRRVALFTGEGGATLRGNTLSLGPLSFEGAPQTGGLHFHGPAVIVDDGAAYLSVETALRKGRLDPLMEIDAELDFGCPQTGLGEMFADFQRAASDSTAGAHPSEPHPGFGRLRGAARLNGVPRQLDAVARVGVSFTALGSQDFVQRRMLWACRIEAGSPLALDFRSIKRDRHPPVQNAAKILHQGSWQHGTLADLELDVALPWEPPKRIRGAFARPDGVVVQLTGTPETFMTLSRPGPNAARVHTTLGFATYLIDSKPGVGMYEYSQCANAPAAKPEDDDG